jgi:DNA-binding MarR family transcriptional regulator
MNPHRARVANLLGALSLHVGDRVRDAVSRQAESGGVLPDAVIVIKDEPGNTLERLRQVLEISQPGAVHLVRKLVDLGWVERRPGVDARSHALYLTPAGTAAAEEILRARRRALEALVEQLSDEQCEQLAGVASRLLAEPVRDWRSLAHVCRLCDRSCCDRCPAHEGYLRSQP